MSIQFIGDRILIRDGQVALDADCCCDDPCISCDPCPTCWSSLSEPCNTVSAVDFSISGVANGSISGTCCICNLVNSSYTIDIENNLCGWHTWQICDCRFVVTRISPMWRVRHVISVSARWGFSQTEIPITDKTSLDASGLEGVVTGNNGSKFCNPFTIKKGHLVHVQIVQTLYTFTGNTSIYHNYFCCFDNSDIRPGCPDDQLYGLCSGLGIGGAATHVYSTKFNAISGTPVGTPDCYDNFGYPELCNFSGATVTIGIPVMIETPPPPPPPPP